MRVAVIGGGGSLGSRIASALQKSGARTTVIGRSSGEVRVDLTRRETLAGLDAFDVVVNASDSVAAPPDALAEYCLENGKLLFETAAEPEAYRRLLARRWPEAPSGSVVLGAGIFPGLSNLLAAEAARTVPDCERLELGIHWTPFSAGGGGMVNLVGHLVGVNTERVVDGRPVQGSPVEPGPSLPFPSGARPTLHLAFSEPTLLRQSTRVPNIAAYGAPGPRFMRGMFLMTPLWLLKSAVMRAVMWLEFTILRRFVLAWRKTPVELVCVATPRNGSAKTFSLRTPDGMACAGRAVAAMVAIAAERRPAPGVHVAESVFALAPVLERMKQLEAQEVERHAPEYQVSTA